MNDIFQLFATAGALLIIFYIAFIIAFIVAFFSIAFNISSIKRQTSKLCELNQVQIALLDKLLIKNNNTVNVNNKEKNE